MRYAEVITGGEIVNVVEADEAWAAANTKKGRRFIADPDGVADIGGTYSSKKFNRPASKEPAQPAEPEPPAE